MTNSMLLCMEKTCEPLSLIVIITYAFHQCEVSQSHLHLFSLSGHYAYIRCFLFCWVLSFYFIVKYNIYKMLLIVHIR